MWHYVKQRVIGLDTRVRHVLSAVSANLGAVSCNYALDTCIHSRMLLRSKEIHHQGASAQQACSCLTSSLIDAWTYARLHKQHTSSSPSASRTSSNKGLLESLTALRHPHPKQDRRPDLFHSPSCRGDAQRVHTSYTEQLQTQLSERSKVSTLSLPDTRSQTSMLQ